MAAGLAAELKHSLGVEPRLIQGSGGVYQVHLDGELVFDKTEKGRYPILGEVSTLIRELRPELA